MKKLLCVFVLCIASLTVNATDFPGVISTSEITQASTQGMASQTCLAYEIKGVCFWMTCTIAGCDIETSIKVAHNIPEVVVQAYDRGLGEPWTESQTINSTAQASADSSFVESLLGTAESLTSSGSSVDAEVEGGGATQASEEQKEQLAYKSVDVYGSPGSTIVSNSLGNTSYGCEGNTTLLYPYFISNLDMLFWRFNLVEQFYYYSWDIATNTYNLTDSTSNSSSSSSSTSPTYSGWSSLSSVTSSVASTWNDFGVNNYGPIYPRHGFSTTNDDLKMGVLAAFRAMHFVTRESQGHVYFTIYADEEPQNGWWPSGPLEKDDEDTGTWQMLYPNMESECQVFPYEPNPDEERRSEDASYVWNFWKKYACCERAGAIFLFSIDI